MSTVKFIDPIAGVHGKLSGESNTYIRKVNGKFITQRCPDRSNHVASEAEAANRRAFGAKYGTARKKKAE